MTDLKYRIIYRDGHVSDDAISWEHVLFWIKQTYKKLPYPLRPIFVIPDEIMLRDD